MVNVAPSTSVSGKSIEWVKANKSLGGTSFLLGGISTICGISKVFLEEDSTSFKAINTTQSIAHGLRGNRQYSIYSRRDDDLGDDINNKPTVALVGKIACIVEKYINPFLFPILGLIGENTFDSYRSVGHLANTLWWRARMFFGEKDHSLSKTSEGLKLLFSTSPTEIKRIGLNSIVEGSKVKLGFLGFIFSGLFTPIKFLIEEENICVNFLSALGNTTQHLVYLFRFTLPEFIVQKRQFNNNVLSCFGLCANGLNIFSPIIDLHKSKFQKIYKELSAGFTMAFFSLRRHFKGKMW